MPLVITSFHVKLTLKFCAPFRASNNLAGNALIAASIYTLGSITIPSLASVYNEMALKKNMDTSVHIQNFYLYFFGLLFNLLGLVLIVTVGHQSIPELFQGHSKVRQYRICRDRSSESLFVGGERSFFVRPKSSALSLQLLSRLLGSNIIRLWCCIFFVRCEDLTHKGMSDTPAWMPVQAAEHTIFGPTSLSVFVSACCCCAQL